MRSILTSIIAVDRLVPKDVSLQHMNLLPQ